MIGTYWFLFPRYRINFFYFIWIWIRLWVGVKDFAVHWAVLWWIGWDLFYWWLERAYGVGTGVAHAAHLGGFFAGLAAALMLRKLYLVKLDGEDMLSLWMTRKLRHAKRRGLDPKVPDDWVPPQIAPQADDAVQTDARRFSSRSGPRDGSPEPMPDLPDAPQQQPDDDEPIPFDPDD